ncbi:Probable carboxyvinyl-carboxyphosphonate phosphorylmutase [Alloactinosynnema sp. L-07]|uniref:isocitrate lyase/PEP mutase family protein n=1 Tax=Alloactinosynnema sp. L-07 TaxID=1653480 RepID=UPI00065EF3C1|nr:isocitrate lyase/phosphoenolpyruvate mutase family protein [Alloactinosynnema sp. L-07]CRK55488.1 Probable carboxyvinyl-carboxyphosphonate phosphorylmutase [Alloactinosynnema sp. L-07]
MTFAELHHGPTPFVLPNAWDVASALLLADAGFPAVATTSLGVSAAAGVADGANDALEPTMALVRALAGRLPVPLTVDLEGGYSDNPAEVAALAVELADLGVAGVNLEDGHRTAAEHASIIEAVAAAAPDLFINARTDTYWLGNGGVDETVRRLTAYRDAGASGVFVPRLADADDIALVVDAVRLPLNILWQPVIPAGVARVSTGSALYRHALRTALTVAERARDGLPPTATAIDYDDLQAKLTR